jgi:hypothetical protein
MTSIATAQDFEPTARTVEACQHRPPWAVGTPSSLSASAIAVRVEPAARLLDPGLQRFRMPRP